MIGISTWLLQSKNYEYLFSNQGVNEIKCGDLGE